MLQRIPRKNQDRRLVIIFFIFKIGASYLKFWSWMGLRLFNTQNILCHSFFSYIKCDMYRKYIFRITTADDVFIKEKNKTKDCLLYQMFILIYYVELEFK